MTFDVLVCRKSLGLTQLELAQRLETHERTVRRWENGITRDGKWTAIIPRKSHVLRMQELLKLKALGPLPAFTPLASAQPLGVFPSRFRM